MWEDGTLDAVMALNHKDGVKGNITWMPDENGNFVPIVSAIDYNNLMADRTRAREDERRPVTENARMSDADYEKLSKKSNGPVPKNGQGLTDAEYKRVVEITDNLSQYKKDQMPKAIKKAIQNVIDDVDFNNYLGIVEENKDVARVKNWIYKNREIAPGKISEELCCVAAYYLYGKATGNYQGDLSDFYVDQINQGRIKMSENSKLPVTFPLSASSELRKDWGMEEKNFSYKNTDQDRIKAVENQNIALVYRNYTDSSGQDRSHFYIIAKDSKGDWKSMDQLLPNKERSKGYNMYDYEWKRIKAIYY